MQNNTNILNTNEIAVLEEAMTQFLPEENQYEPLTDDQIEEIVENARIAQYEQLCGNWNDPKDGTDKCRCEAGDPMPCGYCIGVEAAAYAANHCVRCTFEKSDCVCGLCC